MIPLTEIKPVYENIRSLLGSGEIFGTTIFLLLSHHHRGKVLEIFREEPLEFVLDLQERYHVQLHEDSINRLNAVLHAVYSPAFTHSSEGFLAVANSLAEGDPGLDDPDPVSLAEMYWAVWEVTQIAGDLDYAPNVQALIEELMDGEAEVDTPVEQLALYGYLLDQWTDYEAQLSKGLGLEDRFIPGFDLENRQQMVAQVVD